MENYLVALYYALTAWGFLVIIAGGMAFLGLFDEATLKDAGAKSLLLFIGGLWLFAAPTAKLLDPSGHHFLPLFGLFALPVWLLCDRIIKARRAQQSSQTSGVAIVPPARPLPLPPIHSQPAARRYVTVPSSMADDFDLPPQE